MPYGRIPELKLTSSSRHELKFTLSKTDVSLANGLRRTMIAEVPTMAIDLVTVTENTSPLHDEYIVHRLGLIPLSSVRVDEFEYTRDCDCEEHCDKCSVRFSLDVDFNSGVVGKDETRLVTSKDLVNLSSANELCSGVEPVHDSGDSAELNMESAGIVVARLAKGQAIKLVAIAKKGIGKDHAKWSPVCSVSYRIFPPAVELVLDRINKLMTQEQKKELLAASEGLLQLNAGTEKLEYEAPFRLGRIAISPDTTRKAGQLAEEAGGTPNEIVKYNRNPERFEFVCETTGALPPHVVLRFGLELLRDKVSDLLGHLSVQ